MLTHKSGLKLAKDPTQVDPASPADRALQLLQDDRVYYGNQPIAIAVAETLEAAFEAADRVAVRYAAREAVGDARCSGLPTAYVPKKMGGAGDPAQSQRGDPERALAAADVACRRPTRRRFRPIRRWSRTPPSPSGTGRRS